MINLLAILITGFVGLNATAGILDKEKSHHQYLIELENYKSSPVLKPMQVDFTKLNTIQEDDIEQDYTKDGILYDKNRRPINGTIVLEDETSKQIRTIKNGKVDGYTAFWSKENGKNVLISEAFVVDGQAIKFRYFYLNGQLKSETIMKNNIVLGRHFNSSGVLQRVSISSKNLDKEHAFYIANHYDRSGKLNVTLDGFIPSAYCYLNDSQTRPLTSAEVEYIFQEEKRLAENQEDYEIRLECK